MKKHRPYIYVPKDDLPPGLLEMTTKLRDSSVDMSEKVEVATKLLTCTMLIDNAIWEFEDIYLPFIQENEELMRMLGSLVRQ